MSNPLDSSFSYDYVKISGRRTPGLCEVIGASSPRNWDEIGGTGWSGGILLYRGIKLSHFSIRLYLYDTRDWNDWEAFRPLVQKSPLSRGIPKALDCVHPFLAELGIKALVIEDVRAPDQVDPGVWMIELMCIEYRKLRPSTGAVDGAEATPVDPRDQEIKELEGKVKAERDKLAKSGNL